MSEHWPAVAAAVKADNTALLNNLHTEYAFKGTDVSQVRDQYDQCILHIAVLHSNNDTLQYVLNTYKTLVNAVDHHSRTSLFHIHSAEQATLLLAAGANVAARDNDGNTVLHILAQQNRADLMLLLIDKYNADVNTVNNKGQSVLHYTAQYGYTDQLNLLLDQYHMDVNAADNAGWSALMYCALGTWPQYESHSQCIQSLLQHNADVNHADLLGMTALHVCTDSPAMRILLQHGADPHILDIQLHSALFYTNAENTVIVLEHIKQTAGAEAVQQYVQQRDVFDRTVYHTITDTDKILVLQRYTIDINHVDKFGQTALDYAIETKRDNVEAALRRLGARANRHSGISTHVLIAMSLVLTALGVTAYRWNSKR